MTTRAPAVLKTNEKIGDKTSLGLRFPLLSLVLFFSLHFPFVVRLLSLILYTRGWSGWCEDSKKVFLTVRKYENFVPFFYGNMILWYSKHILWNCEGSQKFIFHVLYARPNGRKKITKSWPGVRGVNPYGQPGRKNTVFLAVQDSSLGDLVSH